jgi:hypothetical protein
VQRLWLHARELVLQPVGSAPLRLEAAPGAEWAPLLLQPNATA